MRPVYVLAVFIPAAVVLEVVHASAPLVFAAAALGVVPTAALMGEATEHLAARTGPGIGGFLNVTFGNAPELIIAFFALLAGLQEVVKASLIGSIVGNILLVLGASMFVGGLGRNKQTFSRTAANAQAAMLLLALAALVLPAVFELIHGGELPGVGEERVDFGGETERLSFGVALVLLLTYAAGLFFSLRSHRSVFNPYPEEEASHGWSIRRSVVLLAVAGVLVGVMSEVLVGSITETAERIGLSEFCIGVFVVAIVGNAAEHWVAVLVAAKDKMDLAVNIAIGSSARSPSSWLPSSNCCRLSSAPTAGARLQRLRTRRRAVRRPYRELCDPGGRVELVRGPSAPGAVRDARPRVLLRLSGRCGGGCPSVLERQARRARCAKPHATGRRRLAGLGLEVRAHRLGETGEKAHVGLAERGPRLAREAAQHVEAGVGDGERDADPRADPEVARHREVADALVG